MTDTEVEDFLINQFETNMGDFLTSEVTDGTTKYTNICYECKSFERPDDGYWFGFHFKPTRPYQKELGKSGKNVWSGFFQVDICAPKDDGKTFMNTAFNAIFAAFPRGYITDGIRILSVGRSSAQSSDDFCFMPASIFWEAYLDN